VFATLISDRQSTAVIRRLLLALAAGLYFACAQSAVAQQADAPEPQDEKGFFSYFPAPPKIKLPSLDIIPFWTDDLKKGRKAYKNGNYSRALKFFRLSSEDGNMVADWYLGHMYRTGRGVPQDDATAFSYYSRVAENDDTDESDSKKLRITIDAQLRVADYYRKGIPAANIEANYSRAANTYLKISSTYGHPGAFYGLGVININGLGVNRNPKQGLKWMAAAARKRYAPAEAFLGDAYWTGRLVPQDKVRGLMWYILAKTSANAEDDPQIFDRFEQLNEAVTEDQRLEAEARAKVWDGQYPVEGGTRQE
jgi:uncharacterized protein